MILAHVVASVAAFCLGLLVIGLRKGTSAHQRAGYFYAGSIYLVSGSGFFIQEVTGSVSIFHWFSVQAILLVSAGLALPLWLRPRVRQWPVWHLRFLFYSYITLILTGMVQFFDHLPFANDAANAIVFLSLPAIAGVVATERLGVARWREMLAARERRPFIQG